MTATPPANPDRVGPESDTQPSLAASGGDPGLPSVCPFLAGGDGSWRSVEPSRSHVCAAVHPPAVLATAKQRQLCLGATHVDCATFKAASELRADPHSDAVEAGLWPRSSSRVVTFDPVRTGLAGGLTTPQARAGGQALLVGLIAVAFVVLVIARSSGPSDPAGGAGPPVPTAAAVASASPATTAPPSSSAPAASPGESSEPRPTPTPEASSAAGQTYKVKRGDTLSGIALKFGVTVKALRKANGLTKYDVIKRGQVLVIPGAGASPSP